MDRIEYYFAPHSPWSHFGHQRLAAIAGRHGARIELKPCDLGRIFAVTGSLPLPKRPPARQAYRLVELRRWRDFLGIELNIHPAHFPVDPTAASLAIIAAAAADGERAAYDLAGRLMRAVWAEERDIADEATLVAIATEAGLDADRILAGREAAVPTYERNTEDALAAGMFGAPWYQLRGEGFWGQDRLDLLDHTLGR
ncbi:MAG: 2-hydroxychromene-2-carboxylate isomerase [Pseudomonadota bacterium]|nr:2-hydroxychromene-2-carboxylate isomerase [Pseudomonadota bacterium]